MNLVYDLELIGPAMYFGLMGDGQPRGRYDDLWAGWYSKLIRDHLGWGAKSGRPYVVHNKASDWRNNLEREANGSRRASDLYRSFETVTFTSGHADVAGCYLALATRWKSGWPGSIGASSAWPKRCGYGPGYGNVSERERRWPPVRTLRPIPGSFRRPRPLDRRSKTPDTGLVMRRALRGTY